MANSSELAGKKRPLNAAPALPDSAYLGTYTSAYYGPASIVERNERLAIVLGPKKYAFALTHWNRNVFSIDPSEHDNEGVSAVTFTFGTYRTRAAKLTVEYLNGSGLGTFARERVRSSNEPSLPSAVR